MKLVRFFLLPFAAMIVLCFSQSLTLPVIIPPFPDYKNPKLSIARRTEDLLSRMTLSEKIAQMCQYVGLEHIKKAEKRLSKQQLKNNDASGFYPGLGVKGVEKMVEEGMIGSFLHVVTAKEANYLQNLAKKSRLQIPLLIGIDAIHGNGMVGGSTIYPSPIGLASTWDTVLVKKTATYTAIEMRETGTHWAFSPNLDVARDARWGRVGETYGEDPFLVSAMGIAVISGLQGDKPTLQQNVLACAKHLIAGSEPVNGLNKAPTDISERTLNEIYLPPFKAAVKAGVFSVMPAHNEINGVPCHAHSYLMDQLLRKNWGFKGFYISDFMDIERLAEIHRTASDQKEAVYLSVKAGMDMHMHGPNFLGPLIALVKTGQISEARIDESVRRILTAKFSLGLFENAIVGETSTKVFTKPHTDLSLDAAQKSIVLLKNNGILPLDRKKYKKIMVTGPNANNQSILGDWSLQQPQGKIVNIVKGLQNGADSTADVTYFNSGESILEMQPAMIGQAGEKVKEFDLCIVVVGDNSLRFEPKRTAGENIDRDDISLAGLQQQLVEELQKSGKPVIVVLVNSRPISIPWINQNVSAVLEAWEPGSFGGTAVADIIYGKVNPSGKLPISFPQNAGQIGTFYNHKPSQYIRTYTASTTGALYEFGYGLSYTSYQYGELKIDKTSIKGSENLRASIEVANTGTMAGDEIVQLYMNGSLSEISKPVKELKGFRKVHLKPGERKMVVFDITPEMLYSYDLKMDYVIEPGTFTVMVGPSSLDSQLKTAKFEYVLF